MASQRTIDILNEAVQKIGQQEQLTLKDQATISGLNARIEVLRGEPDAGNSAGETSVILNPPTPAPMMPGPEGGVVRPSKPAPLGGIPKQRVPLGGKPQPQSHEDQARQADDVGPGGGIQYDPNGHR